MTAADTTSSTEGATRPERLPRRVRLAFGAGQGGSAIFERLVFMWLYFVWVGQGLEGGTVYLAPALFGVLLLGGRLVDAVTDPVVARWSDGHEGRLGRRRPFMLGSGLPFVVVGAALFFPPVTGTSPLNAVYLGGGLAVFYVLLTLYLVPYAGLLADLSPTVADRVDLATSNAVFQLLGVAVALIVPPLLLGTRGVLPMVLVLGVVAVCLLYVPTLIDERRYSQARPSTTPLLPAVRATLRNRPFVIALLGTNVLWLGFNLVSLNTPLYVTVLVGLDETAVALYSAVLLGVSLLTFPVVNAATKRFGLRRVMIAALVASGLAQPLLFLIPSPPFTLEPAPFALMVFGLGGIGLAGLFIVPSAIIAAVADYDHHTSGQRREAMYFAVYWFTVKVNIGLSTLVAGMLLQTLGSPLGIQITGPLGGAAALAGAVIFLAYPEHEVVRAARTDRVGSS
jgi:glycoside/pentoside/hexuronide:cation symporter, GPH family